MIGQFALADDGKTALVLIETRRTTEEQVAGQGEPGRRNRPISREEVLATKVVLWDIGVDRIVRTFSLPPESHSDDVWISGDGRSGLLCSFNSCQVLKLAR